MPFLSVVLGKVVFVGMCICFRPFFSLLYAPVHINEFFIMFFIVGMRGEPAFLAVKRCLLDIDLL